MQIYFQTISISAHLWDIDRSNVIFDVAKMQKEAKAVRYFKSQFWLILSSGVHLRRTMGLKGRVVWVLIYQQRCDFSGDFTVEFSWQQKPLKKTPRLVVWATSSTDFIYLFLNSNAAGKIKLTRKWPQKGIYKSKLNG